jgi:hypothetical protein
MRPMGFLLRRIPPTGEWKLRALARRASFSGWVKLHGLTAMASFNAGSRSLPWSGIPPEGHSSTPSRVWPSGCGAKIRTRVTRLSLFRKKGDYGVGLDSSRGCNGNGLSYVQESDKALKRKRRGSDTFRQTQGVILSNVEGWHLSTDSGCHPELLSKDADRRMETPGFSPESFILLYHLCFVI